MGNFEVLIEPGKSEGNYWRDLWNYRELFYILAWRDIKIRYKQAILGVGWALIRPLLTMIIFTVVFGRIANLSNTVTSPYALVVFAAMLPWQLFSSGLSEASNSLVGSSALITKVYFPRVIVPISALMSSVLDFFISLVIFFFMLLFYKQQLSWALLLLPFWLLLVFLLSAGVSLLLSALNVRFRDFRYIIPFIIQFGLFISPVGFSTNVVSSRWVSLYSLNPMVGIIEGFRWSLLGEGQLSVTNLFISISATLMILYFGVWYFRKTEKSFADHI